MHLLRPQPQAKASSQSLQSLITSTIWDTCLTSACHTLLRVRNSCQVQAIEGSVKWSEDYANQLLFLHYARKEKFTLSGVLLLKVVFFECWS
jgi:hypothetical protein